MSKITYMGLNRFKSPDDMNFMSLYIHRDREAHSYNAKVGSKRAERIEKLFLKFYRGK